MKKTLLIMLFFTLLLTGCQKKDQPVPQIDNTPVVTEASTSEETTVEYQYENPYTGEITYSDVPLYEFTDDETKTVTYFDSLDAREDFAFQKTEEELQKLAADPFAY